MGSKSGGSSAPAPDPRLIEAQIRSMGVQEDAINRILKTTEELQPLQRDQLQFGLDTARTAYQQSQEDRAWSLGRRNLLAGAQDDVVREANAFDTEAKREELAGQALADVNQQFGAARGQQARDMARRGVDPSSGAALALREQSTLQQALAGAAAKNQTRTAARQEGRQLKRSVADMLSGYPAMASGQTGQGAQVGASGITLANQGAGGLTAGGGMAAGLAGQLGQNATSMFGQQAAREANMQGDGMAGTLGGIGSLLGGAAKIYSSDRRLKVAIVPVGVHEATGLQLYEFNYVDGVVDPAKRWRGVMADEVLQVMPEAVSTDERGFMRVDYGLLGIPFEEVT